MSSLHRVLNCQDLYICICCFMVVGRELSCKLITVVRDKLHCAVTFADPRTALFGQESRTYILYKCSGIAPSSSVIKFKTFTGLRPITIFKLSISLVFVFRLSDCCGCQNTSGDFRSHRKIGPIYSPRNRRRSPPPPPLRVRFYWGGTPVWSSKHVVMTFSTLMHRSVHSSCLGFWFLLKKIHFKFKPSPYDFDRIFANVNMPAKNMLTSGNYIEYVSRLHIT